MIWRNTQSYRDNGNRKILFYGICYNKLRGLREVARVNNTIHILWVKELKVELLVDAAKGGGWEVWILAFWPQMLRLHEDIPI